MTFCRSFRKWQELANISDFPDGVVFENHANTLSDLAEEVQERLHVDHRTSAARPLYADQICVYRNSEGIDSLLLIVEYKPPHKLSVHNLRAGLRPMNVLEEVVNRTTIPAEGDEKLRCNADRLVAAVVTQTFSQMIESGVEYSCVNTGEALVFLQVRQDDPTTVYYHLAEPNQEVAVDDDLGFLYPRTAISQMFSFCLMALKSSLRSQQWRDDASRRLPRYEVDYEAVLRQIPEEERKQTPSSAFKPSRYHVNPRSPYFFWRRKARSSCHTDEAVGDQRASRSDRSDESAEGPETPTKSSGPAKGKEPAQRVGERSRSDIGARKYCTQACLLGLVQQTGLDKNCPNVALHRRRVKDNRHAVNKRMFRQLLQRQLGEDLDHDCEPLGKQGARGALFKITLRQFGYTLAGKGTVQAFVEDLRYEGRVYQRLKSLQGSVIPVHLGNIDLAKVYYLDIGVRIQHMTMMAWVGEQAAADGEVTHCQIDEQVRSTVEEIRWFGVTHGDLHGPNILWSQELERVMLIDFERSGLSPCKRRYGCTDGRGVVLQSRSGNQPGTGRTLERHENGTIMVSKEQDRLLFLPKPDAASFGPIITTSLSSHKLAVKKDRSGCVERGALPGIPQRA